MSDIDYAKKVAAEAFAYSPHTQNIQSHQAANAELQQAFNNELERQRAQAAEEARKRDGG